MTVLELDNEQRINFTIDYWDEYSADDSYIDFAQGTFWIWAGTKFNFEATSSREYTLLEFKTEEEKLMFILKCM